MLYSPLFSDHRHPEVFSPHLDQIIIVLQAEIGIRGPVRSARLLKAPYFAFQYPQTHHSKVYTDVRASLHRVGIQVDDMIHWIVGSTIEQWQGEITSGDT